MSIKSTQENLIRQKILQNQLQKGEYPSVSLIDQMMNSTFADKITGLPRFVHRPIEKGATSDTNAYNSMLTEIREDLIVSFEETKVLNNQIMALANYYESNRVRMDQALKDAETKAGILSIRANSRLNRDVIGDSFVDFSKLEFNEDNRRNVPRTNAFMDLRHGEALLNKLSNSTIKHDISGAKTNFTAITEDALVFNMTPISNALQDVIQDTWRSIVSHDRTGGVEAQLDLELEEKMQASQFEIDMQSAKPVIVTLYLSVDGETYTEYETRKVNAHQQWLFERQDVKFIRLKLVKKEEDQINGMEYEYIFGAKSIELKLETFLIQNYVISKPHPIHYHDAIDIIHLEVEDYVPPGTGIRYYVGLDYNTNIVEWQEIRPNMPVPMRMIQKYEMFINPLEIDKYTEGYGEECYENFGQKFYSLAKLPYKPQPKSVTLQMGRNMWAKETIMAPFVYEPPVDETGNPIDVPPYQTSMGDWIRSITPEKTYLSIDNYQDILEKDTFQRYTTYIYVDNAEAIKKTIEGTINVGEEASFALYVNNSKIKAINDKYQLNLNMGWNKVEILTYSRDFGQEILFNLYIREVSSRIYADKEPLREVSLYDLLNNTSSRIYNRFAIDEFDRIIVNQNVKLLDAQKNGVGYSLAYHYSVSEKEQHQLRFMAILSKESEEISTSPRLKEYRLIIE